VTIVHFHRPRPASLLAALVSTAVMVVGPVLASPAAGATATAPDTSLQIPDSAWPAGHGSIDLTAITPVNADSPINVFDAAPFHGQPYSRAGIQSGVLQQSQLRVNEAGAVALAAWLGTAYATPDGAAGMLADSVASMASHGYSAQPCYLTGEPGCHLYFFLQPVLGGGFIHAIYAVWARGTVLGQILIRSWYATTVYSADAVGQAVMTLLQSGRDVLSAASPGAGSAGSPPRAPAPSITLGSVTLLHEVRGSLKSTRSLRLHETGYFRATFQLSAIGIYGSDAGLDFYFPHARLTVASGENTLFDGAADLQQKGDGTPYFQSVGSFDRSSALGTLQVRLTGLLGSASATADTQITILPAKKTSRR
jgi:hypothetical protein